MRQYLVNGFITFAGSQHDLFGTVVQLKDGQVMDFQRLRALEGELLAEHNSSRKTVARSVVITSFQPLETPVVNKIEIGPPLGAWGTAASALCTYFEQRMPKAAEPREPLNLPEVLPPVDCPLLIKIGGSLVKAERVNHLRSKGDAMTYQLDDGTIVSGRFPWTYP